jgi:hypothetical protein
MHHTATVLMFLLATLPTLPSSSSLRSDDGQRNDQRSTGELRCMAVENDLVSVVPHGFFLPDLNEFVSQDEVSPSADGGYWRCEQDGKRLTFLVPPENY